MRINFTSQMTFLARNGILVYECLATMNQIQIFQGFIKE